MLPPPVFQETLFGEAALLQKEAEFGFAEPAVFVVEARVVHNHLFQLRFGHADAHHFRAFGQVGAFGEVGERVLPAAQILLALGFLHVLGGDFFAADFDDVVGAGGDDAARAEADEGERDQAEHDFRRAAVFFYGCKHGVYGLERVDKRPPL